MDYFVLKGRELREPVSESHLREELDRGALTPDDLVRPADGFLWTRLRKVLAAKANGSVRKSILDIPMGAPIEAPLPANDWLDKPVRVGGICLGVGAFVLLLSSWPLLLYGPLLAAAFAAGIVAMFKRRIGAGVLLCAGAVLVPALFNWLAVIVGPVEPPSNNSAVAASRQAAADPAADLASNSGVSRPAIAVPVDEAPTPAPETASSGQTPQVGATPSPEKRASVALPKAVSPSASLPDAGRGKETNK
jgi:hypothetical protein